MFQDIFGEVDQFGRWYFEWIQTDAGPQFTSKEFQEIIFLRGVWLTLVAPDNH